MLMILHMINIIQLKKFMHGLIKWFKHIQHLATSFTVGQSYEKRDLKGLKISSNKAAVKRDGTPVNKKKAVWWDGGKLIIFLYKIF